ncbi:MAG: GDP-mannose 4,6-dehydratase [Candidatus Aenigmarchaeota archaeon]|nr:GDP-mannose 4,6-dehydratase [Candidatus Aenigmarchaeota archaeon]
MARVLITGGNGLIGSHLAERLIARGDEVALLDVIFNSNTRGIKCEKINADVRDAKAVEKAAEGKDVIIHFAAVSRVAWGQERPVECVETNSIGTANVLEAARKANAFVFIGSSREVYGEPEKNPVSETARKEPVSIYGITKLSGEKLLMAYRKYFKLRGAIFRFSNVYGSTRDLEERVIPIFIRKALKNETLKLNGGAQILDFTHLDDTLDGILRAYDKRAAIDGEDVHFVTGRGASVAELAKLTVKAARSSSHIITGPVKSFDVQKFVGDNSKAKKLLGWTPKISLEEGLKRTVELYRKAM